jgi:hypothetical protein
MPVIKRTAQAEEDLIDTSSYTARSLTASRLYASFMVPEMFLR